MSETDLRTALNANWSNNMQNTMSSASDQDTMEIIKLDGSSPTVSFAGVGNSLGQGNDQVIVQACSLVQLRTAIRGPRGRGRVFLPFVAESKQNNGALDPTSLGTQETAWNTFVDDMSLDGWDLVVASYVHAAAQAVTNITLRPVVATQNRRIKRLVA